MPVNPHCQCLYLNFTEPSFPLILKSLVNNSIFLVDKSLTVIFTSVP